MPRPQIQARVEPAREKEVEQFADENNMSKAGAVRHLVERGLDYEEGRLAAPESSTPQAEYTRFMSSAWGSIVAAVILIVAGTVATPDIGLLQHLGTAAAEVALALALIELLIQLYRHDFRPRPALHDYRRNIRVFFIHDVTGGVR